MISKELLSEVLGQVYIDATRSIKDENKHFAIGNKHVFLGDKGFNHWNDSINIYELSHKCKEWAYKQGFIIDTGFHKYYINQFKANCYGWVSSNINIRQHFNECTEYEAIFKACQWILDNKEG